jgi:hypothetical protein
MQLMMELDEEPAPAGEWEEDDEEAWEEAKADNDDDMTTTAPPDAEPEAEPGHAEPPQAEAAEAEEGQEEQKGQQQDDEGEDLLYAGLEVRSRPTHTDPTVVAQGLVSRGVLVLQVEEKPREDDLLGGLYAGLDDDNGGNDNRGAAAEEDLMGGLYEDLEEEGRPRLKFRDVDLALAAAHIPVVLPRRLVATDGDRTKAERLTKAAQEALRALKEPPRFEAW